MSLEVWLEHFEKKMFYMINLYQVYLNVAPVYKTHTPDIELLNFSFLLFILHYKH